MSEGRFIYNLSYNNALRMIGPKLLYASSSMISETRGEIQFCIVADWAHGLQHNATTRLGRANEKFWCRIRLVVGSVFWCE
ncbi:unnamed protein product [Onchocerca flexuosa]|uniref:Uncharacterized protein n=1 Tax=Onchocerca flexuosa TaxID=387005 RepID=A0A183H4X2_9BILA|nr:unnamed protein product [Onchocerca flexuosa]